MLVRIFKRIILYSYLVYYLESTDMKQYNSVELHVSDLHMLSFKSEFSQDEHN
jgi:hypothetical protein